MIPKPVIIPFFNPARDGLAFILEDDTGTALDPAEWDKIDIAIFEGRDYREPVAVVEPYIDNNVVSISFSNEQMREIFSRSEYRIEPRFFSGGSFDTYFFYKINLANLYNG